MTTVFGVFGAQSFVVLMVAVIGVVPVVLYRERTPTVFVVPFVFLLIAAFATNFEDLVLPDLLNWVEHSIGNLGAGIAFAVAAYTYRQRSVLDETEKASVGDD